MKKNILVLMMLIVSASYTKSFSRNFLNVLRSSDTTNLPHVIDGNLSEWSAIPFSSDKETGISTAIDNDNTQFYIALKISKVFSVSRVMSMGMNLFIDLKGKHREGTTIEFPLKATAFEIRGMANKFRDGNGKATKVDPEVIKNEIMPRMVVLKVTGITGMEEEKLYGLTNNNGLNISFNINENANELYIEYAIPFQLLDASASTLSGKKISVGLKLNAPDFSSQQGATATTMQIVKAPTGVVPKLSTGRASNLLDPPGTLAASNETRSPFQEIYIWNKYDMKF